MEQMYEKLLDERDIYIKSLVQKYNEAVSHIQLQQQCLAQLTQQNQELQRRVQKFLIQTATQDVLVKQLQIQLKDLKAKESELEQRMRVQFQQKVVKTGEAVQDLRRELLEQQKGQKQSIAVKLAKAQDQIRQLQQLERRLKDQIHKLSLENQQLSRPKSDSQVSKLIKTVDLLQKQALFKQNQADKLVFKLADCQATLINLQAQKRVFQERLMIEQNTNREQRNALHQQVRELGTVNQSLKAQLKSLAEKNEELRFSNKEYLTEIKNLKPRYQRMIISLQEKAKQLQISVWNLQDQLAFILSSPLNSKQAQPAVLNLQMSYRERSERQVEVRESASVQRGEQGESKQEAEWKRLTVNLLKIVE